MLLFKKAAGRSFLTRREWKIPSGGPRAFFVGELELELLSTAWEICLGASEQMNELTIYSAKGLTERAGSLRHEQYKARVGVSPATRQQLVWCRRSLKREGEFDV